MLAVLVVLPLLQLSLGQTVTAKLELVQYDPRVFRLTFSESVDQPEFQLLLNNIYDIPHRFISPDTHADTFFL